MSCDGHVLLCFERPYPEEVNLGNVLTTPIAELWNSPAMPEGDICLHPYRFGDS